MSDTTKYRVISEPDVGQDHRSHRGQEIDRQDRRHQSIILEAPSILDIDPDHPALQNRRLIAVEELAPAIEASDEQLTKALFEPIDTPYGIIPSPIDTFVDDLDTPLYGSGDFSGDVENVVQVLRDSEIVPGLDISILRADFDPDYTMIEIRDEHKDIYLSVGEKLSNLTLDREATGTQAYIAIARALIEIVNLNSLS